MQPMPLQSFLCLALLHASLASAIQIRPHMGVAIPLAKRANLTDQNGVVNVTVLRNQLARVSGKVRRGFKAFYLNTGSFHPNDKTRLAATKRETGPVALTNDNGALWHGMISVGTPPKDFTVDFDTGSSDLFLPGRSCKENCDGHSVYDTTSSTTATNLGRNFSLAYADGSTVQGNQFSDVVTIAGLNATEQTLGSATTYSAGFGVDVFPPDGLMGMAFPAISAFRARPLFHTLIDQGKTTSPQFGFKLAKNGSELFLGGSNSELFSGPITQTPVTQAGFWQVSLESVGVGEQATSNNLEAIIDTGTTLITGDARSVASLYGAIQGSKDASNIIGPGFFTFPCQSVPDVALTFNGKSFAISADAFNLGTISIGSEDCVGGVAAFDSDFWVVGDVFLQNVYTVFDVGTQTVGFAALA